MKRESEFTREIESVQDLVDQGHKYREEQNYTAALQSYRKALGLAKNDPELMFYLGYVYEDLRVFELALDY